MNLKKIFTIFICSIFLFSLFNVNKAYAKKTASSPAFQNNLLNLYKDGKLKIIKGHKNFVTLSLPVNEDINCKNYDTDVKIPYEINKKPSFKILDPSSLVKYINTSTENMILQFMNCKNANISSNYIPLDNSPKLYRLEFNYSINSYLPVYELGKLKKSDFNININYYDRNKKYLYKDTASIDVFRNEKDTKNFDFNFLPQTHARYITLTVTPCGRFSGTFSFLPMSIYKYNIKSEIPLKYKYTINHNSSIDTITQTFYYNSRIVTRIIKSDKSDNKIYVTKTINYKKTIQTLKESDILNIDSNDIEFIDRDLKLKNDLEPNCCYTTDYTTPYYAVFSKNNSLKCLNGYTSVQTSKSNFNNLYTVSLNSNYYKDTEYFTIIDGGVFKYTYGQKCIAGTKSSLKYTIDLNHAGPIIVPSRAPFGYHGTFIITNHADSTTVKTLKAVILGSSDTSNKMYTKSGFLYYKIPATWAVFGKSYGTSEGIDNNEFKEVVDKMYTEGGFEIVPHTISPIASENTPKLFEEYLNKFTIYNSKNWIDHSLGAGTGCADIKSQGALEGKNFSLPIFKEYGYDNCWSYVDMTMNNGINMLEDAENYPQILFKNNNLGFDDYSLYQWNAYRPRNFIDETNSYNLNKLCDENGICIMHDYFAHIMQNHLFFNEENNEYTITDKFNNVLSLLSDYRNNKQLWIPTVRDYMDYTLKVHNIDIDANNNQIKIDNYNNVPIKGFTYIIFDGTSSTGTFKTVDLNNEGSNIF